jgi:pyruvyltransferase
MNRRRKGLGIKTRLNRWMGVKDYRIWPTVPFPSVGLVYWVPNSHATNFGDELSRVVVSAMLSRRELTLLDQTATAHRLLAIGSILHCAPEGAAIWGAGANVNEGLTREYPFSSLDVRAVRGPRTAEFLRDRGVTVPNIFGDPALLLRELFPKRFQATAEFKIGVVPHYSDFKTFSNCGHYVINPMRGWNLCIADILKCSMIVSSSLHGIIIAETWGIPARYVRVTDHEGLFKYKDYYEGTGRPDFRYAKSISEAIEMGGESPPIFDAAALMDAFPYDLWMPNDER